MAIMSIEGTPAYIATLIIHGGIVHYLPAAPLPVLAGQTEGAGLCGH
jgi:hypothetical protein